MVLEHTVYVLIENARHHPPKQFPLTNLYDREYSSAPVDERLPLGNKKKNLDHYEPILAEKNNNPQNKKTFAK